jgi:uncharacterized membrane protein YphA (DoxX/SURF4 family)
MTAQPLDNSLDYSQWSRWTRFWHEPIRAELLAAARIFFAFVILADQLVQYLPNLAYFFGPDGVGPEGFDDAYLLRNWRWPVLFFHTDNMTVIGLAFAAWMAVTVAMLLGCFTRIATILVWLGTMCFLARNPNLKNGGDDVVQLALFLLVISPCGRAMSLDWWRRARAWRRCEGKADPSGRLPDSLLRPMIAPWPVRIFQLQLCVMYFTTGVAKLRGHTWWEGISIHNVLNDVTMSRWSYAQLPLPIWITAPLTYASLAFEVLFPLLVLIPKTRKWTLWFGVCFHLGIYATIEVGWFSFYTIAMYAVWIPAKWWDRVRGREMVAIETSKTRERSSA